MGTLQRVKLGNVDMVDIEFTYDPEAYELVNIGSDVDKYVD